MDALTSPFVQAVAGRLIEMLEAGVAPWQKPWDSEPAASRLPTNPVTGNRYKGVNALYLMAQGHEDPRWLTYKQAESIGAQVRRGEKGTPIQYWKFSEERARQDDDGRPVLDDSGKLEKYTVKLERPALFMATVFNASQIDGLPGIERRAQRWEPLERAESLIQACGPQIQHGAGDRAFYRPSSDTIHLPERESFPSQDRYYATVLHELGHWTGHPARLARDLEHPFGSEGYAREELRAEIASMLMGEELGIGHDPSQHAAYVGSWIKVIKDDPLEIFRAASDAERIQDFVLAHEQKLALKVDLAASAGVEADMDSTKARLLGLEELTPEELAVVEAKRQLDVDQTPEARERFRAAGLAAFALDLPATWSGRTRSVETTQLKWDDEAGATASKTEWTLVGVLHDWSLQPLATYPNKADADRMAQRLALIDAHAEPNVLEQAAKLARLHEAAVQRDPASTPEERTAAREARKGAELLATQNDVDLQRRMAEQEKTGAVATASTVGQANQQDRQRQLAHGSRMNGGRQYLAVPYGERGLAKAAGAKWDRSVKSWYADAGTDAAKLARWMPDQNGARQGPAMRPAEEFSEALRAAGCIVTGEHPIMDGKKHRITVQGEAHSENSGSGFYVGYLDGYPAGYIKNNKTGLEVRWKAKGYSLSTEEKAQLAAQAASKLQQRSQHQADAQEAAAQRVAHLVSHLMPATAPTPYMTTKQVEPTSGVLTDAQRLRTYVPATDADGKLWTVQVIQPDGTKRFPKNSRKAGCFHAVGGLDAVASAPALLIAEGYATANDLAKAVGFATVAAFDPGNLPEVAAALHKKFPEKPVIIAGDNDVHLERTQGVNPGRMKAEEAARLAGGRVLLPVFGPGEQLGAPKEFKDFNDLARKSCLSEEAVSRQVKCAVEQELTKARFRTLSQVHDDRQHRSHLRVG
jgi:antirestriction protein ArdC/phage/plasmid primase-like uncharacterized protein